MAIVTGNLYIGTSRCSVYLTKTSKSMRKRGKGIDKGRRKEANVAKERQTEGVRGKEKQGEAKRGSKRHEERQAKAEGGRDSLEKQKEAK